MAWITWFSLPLVFFIKIKHILTSTRFFQGEYSQYSPTISGMLESVSVGLERRRLCTLLLLSFSIYWRWMSRRAEMQQCSCYTDSHNVRINSFRYIGRFVNITHPVQTSALSCRLLGIVSLSQPLSLLFFSFIPAEQSQWTLSFCSVLEMTEETSSETRVQGGVWSAVGAQKQTCRPHQQRPSL